MSPSGDADVNVISTPKSGVLQRILGGAMVAGSGLIGELTRVSITDAFKANVVVTLFSSALGWVVMPLFVIGGLITVFRATAEISGQRRVAPPELPEPGGPWPAPVEPVSDAALDGYREAAVLRELPVRDCEIGVLLEVLGAMATARARLPLGTSAPAHETETATALLAELTRRGVLVTLTPGRCRIAAVPHLPGVAVVRALPEWRAACHELLRGRAEAATGWAAALDDPADSATAQRWFRAEEPRLRALLERSADMPELIRVRVAIPRLAALADALDLWYARIGKGENDTGMATVMDRIVSAPRRGAPGRRRWAATLVRWTRSRWGRLRSWWGTPGRWTAIPTRWARASGRWLAVPARWARVSVRWLAIRAGWAGAFGRGAAMLGATARAVRRGVSTRWRRLPFPGRGSRASGRFPGIGELARIRADPNYTPPQHIRPRSLLTNLRARAGHRWALAELESATPQLDRIATALEAAWWRLPREDVAGEVCALLNLALVHLRQGRLDAARDRLELAETLAADDRDPAGLAHVHEVFGVLDWAVGAPGRALRSWQAALSEWRDLGDRLGIARCLQHLGSAAVLDPELGARLLDPAADVRPDEVLRQATGWLAHARELNPSSLFAQTYSDRAAATLRTAPGSMRRGVRPLRRVDRWPLRPNEMDASADTSSDAASA
ncbi:tetratricopeptide repeat protein [Nocardia sp. NBC_01503]|uniref:tetratricopeptide repeat protein n=1 Tax=Nocardia sp. NBC_01503 TaxID=2975997 RepID=UPI002E7C3209|nr:tetratricopeptide repeat protein [Nocardia sp. NBC_01503]WTL31033.1 tetratricopeptide repeat protein [Nocardia sp. NBC_01503]